MTAKEAYELAARCHTTEAILEQIGERARNGDGSLVLSYLTSAETLNELREMGYSIEYIDGTIISWDEQK